MYRAKRMNDIEWDLAADVVAWRNDCQQAQVQRNQLLKVMRYMLEVVERTLAKNDLKASHLLLADIRELANMSIATVEEEAADEH